MSDLRGRVTSRIVSDEEAEAYEKWRSLAYPPEMERADGERAARIVNEVRRRQKATQRGEKLSPWSEFEATL